MEKAVSYTTASVYTETKEKIDQIVKAEKEAHSKSKSRDKAPSTMSMLDRLVNKEHARLVKNGTIKQN